MVETPSLRCSAAGKGKAAHGVHVDDLCERQQYGLACQVHADSLCQQYSLLSREDLNTASCDPDYASTTLVEEVYLDDGELTRARADPQTTYSYHAGS